MRSGVLPESSGSLLQDLGQSLGVAPGHIEKKLEREPSPRGVPWGAANAGVQDSVLGEGVQGDLLSAPLNHEKLQA